MTEPSLFDTVARGLSKRADPSTSREAAAGAVADGTVNRMEAEAVSMVRQHPGRTGSELDRLYAGDHPRATARCISKRLRMLARKDQIAIGEKRECRCTGRSALTWWPKGAHNAES